MRAGDCVQGAADGEERGLTFGTGIPLKRGDRGRKCPDLWRSFVSAFTVTVDQPTEGEEL